MQLVRVESVKLVWIGGKGEIMTKYFHPTADDATTKPTSHVISSSSDSLSFVISLHDEAAAVLLCFLFFPFSLHYKIDVCTWVEHWWQCSLNFNSTRQRQFQLKLPPLPFDAPSSPKQRRIIVDFIINSPQKKTLYFPTCQTQCIIVKSEERKWQSLMETVFLCIISGKCPPLPKKDSF